MCSQKSRLSCCVHTINKSSLHLSSLELKIPFPYSKFCPYVGEHYSCRPKKEIKAYCNYIISSIFRMILTCSISVARFRKRIVLSFLTSTLRAAVAPQVEFPTCCACFSFASLSLHKRTLSGKPSTEAILFVYISIKWGQKG